MLFSFPMVFRCIFLFHIHGWFSFCYWFLTCIVVSKWGLYATDSLKFENCFVASWLLFQLPLEWLGIYTHRLLGQGRCAYICTYIRSYIHVCVYKHIHTYMHTHIHIYICICLRSSIKIVALKFFLTLLNFWFDLSITKIGVIRISQ